MVVEGHPTGGCDGRWADAAVGFSVAMVKCTGMSRYITPHHLIMCAHYIEFRAGNAIRTAIVRDQIVKSVFAQV
jgi:hypothetical protein